MEPELTAYAQPLYQQICEQLMRKISSGELKEGDRLPSEKELCDTFGVSRITSKKALEILAENRLILRRRGKGSFVAAEPAGGNVTFRSIAFLLPSFNDAFGTRLLCSVEAACESLGFHLILKRTHESPEEEEKALRSLDNEKVAGILMIPAHGEYYNAEILRQVLDKRPLVFVDRKMRGLPIASVSTDNAAAAETAVNHLFELGHRNIAFYSGAVTHTSTLEDRRQGFSRAFADRGLPPNLAHICPAPLDPGDTDTIIRHLSEHPEISAALAAEFRLAPQIKDALAALGRQIPRDFSIITFDHPVYTPETPVFAYLRQDEETIGRAAVEALRRIIQGESPLSIGDIRIPAELVPGGSTEVINDISLSK
jgi:DNA-binding LacI/PurR family transcriptional regulator